MVSQSQTGQLFELLEQLGAGISSQVTSTEKVAVSQKSEEQPKNEIDRTTITAESSSDNSELSTEEDTAELFSLCKEIQDLVDGPNNAIEDSDFDFLTAVTSVSDKSITTKQKLSVKEIDTDIMELFDYPADKISTDDNDSGFSSEEDTSFPYKSNEDDFLDLFPMLSSV